MLGTEFLPRCLSITIEVCPQGWILVVHSKVPGIVRACRFITVAISIVDVCVPVAVYPGVGGGHLQLGGSLPLSAGDEPAS